MTFKPPSGLTATEMVHEADLEGYVFEDAGKQYVQGGKLGLVPEPDTGLAHDPVEFGWPFLAWGQYDDLVNPPGLTKWGYHGEGLPGEPYWVPEGTWLAAHVTAAGQDSYIRQAADETGHTFWADQADNTAGYIVQVRLEVVDAQTGEWVVDDGTRRQRMFLFPHGIEVENHPELDIPAEMVRPRTVRFIGKGDDFTILMDDGFAARGTGAFTTPSVTKELVLGMAGAGVGTFLVDHVHQYHGDAPVDVPDAGSPSYSTAFLEAALPVFAPGRVLSAWDKAYFDIEGTNAGTTRVVIEYRSSATPDWTQSGAAVTLSSTPRHEVDLASVPVAGDGSDEIRFKVQQNSADGSGRPYDVTRTMVTAVGEGTTLTLFPNWGPESGATVAIDVPAASAGLIQFPVQSNWPAGAATELAYHFDELSGNVLDASGNAYHGTIPAGSSAKTLRAQAGWFGYGIHAVDGGGKIDVPVAANLDYDQDVTISFFCKAHTRTAAGLVWEHKSGSRGVEIRINTAGKLEVFVTNGSGSDSLLTYGGALAGADSWVMVWVKLLKTQGKIRARVSGGDWEETATAGQDYWTGLPATGADMLVGCWGTFDEFHWYAGDRDEATWATLSTRNVRRSVFTAPAVYVDGEEVTGERVNYYHPNRIYVRMPPHEPGEVPVWVDDTGTKHHVPDGYRYVRSYEIDVSRELEAAEACTTKSPFRMGYTVPEGDVNLALVQGPELAVTSHMSRIGLEHLEAGNIAAYRQGEFALAQPDTGAGDYLYADSVDTDDLLVSVKSVMRRDFRPGRPLFYKYLLGRGRRYLRSPGALSASDIEAVRRSIFVQDQNGDRVRPEDYPWEVDVSSTDFHGDPLPANTYSVVLYVERPGDTGRTYFAVYDAVDAGNDWLRQDGFKEVINPVPLFERVSAFDGPFQYKVALGATGYHSLTVKA